MLHIAIVEDEVKYASQLEEYLKRFAEEKQERIETTVFRDGSEIVQNYSCAFDLILLDIQMPRMDGMTTAKAIRKVDTDVVIIFITNMAQYAINGYEVDALDYILKPINYFAFSQRLSRAVGRIKSHTKNYLVISARGGTQKLDVDSIYYVESQGHNLIFHTGSGAFSMGGTMKEIEEKLLPFHFFRCNKGYLVALRHVDSIRDGCAVVHGELLLISRARKGEFMEALTDFVGGVSL